MLQLRCCTYGFTVITTTIMLQLRCCTYGFTIITTTIMLQLRCGYGFTIITATSEVNPLNIVINNAFFFFEVDSDICSTFIYSYISAILLVELYLLIALILFSVYSINSPCTVIGKIFTVDVIFISITNCWLLILMLQLNIKLQRADCVLMCIKQVGFCFYICITH